jgi:integrase
LDVHQGIAPTIPPFVKVATDAWTAAAGLSDGPLFRCVRRRKYQEKTPQALSERMIWHIVMKYARKTGLADKLGPHDLRRTCAKPCRVSGGDLEQIQFLLGHASATGGCGNRPNLGRFCVIRK